MLPLLSEKKSCFITISLYQEGSGCKPAFLVNPKQDFKCTKTNEVNKPRATCFSQSSSKIWQDVFLFPPVLKLQNCLGTTYQVTQLPSFLME